MDSNDEMTIGVLVILILFVILCILWVAQGDTFVANQPTKLQAKPSTIESSALVDKSMEESVVKLVNEIRVSGATCGNIYKPPVEPLVWNDQLAKAASEHSTDMANKNYFSHDSQDGRTFATRITNAGYTPYRTVGENIAAGYDTPASVVAGWMSSTGHCNNIMNSSFKDTGVGFAYNSSSDFGTYWTQNFGSK